MATTEIVTPAQLMEEAELLRRRALFFGGEGYNQKCLSTLERSAVLMTKAAIMLEALNVGGGPQRSGQ